jgi:hypothetical protein
MEQKNAVYLSLSVMYPLFVFLAFYIAGLAGGIPPLSAASLIGLYSGQWAMLAIMLSVLCLADLGWYHLSLFPVAISEPKNHLLLLVIPEVIAVAGFVLAVVSKDPWVVLPFAALGFANYAYAYMRISSAVPKT